MTPKKKRREGSSGSHKRVPSLDFKKLSSNLIKEQQIQKISSNTTGSTIRKAGIDAGDEIMPPNLKPEMLSVGNDYPIVFASAESLRNNAIGEGNFLVF